MGVSCHVCLGVGNSPLELLPLSFILIVMSPVQAGVGGFLDEKVVPFMLPEHPPRITPLPKSQPAEDAG